MALSTIRDGTASMTIAHKCPGDQINILVRSNLKIDFDARGFLSAVSATHTTNVSIIIINIHSFLFGDDPFLVKLRPIFLISKFFSKKTKKTALVLYGPLPLEVISIFFKFIYNLRGVMGL